MPWGRPPAQPSPALGQWRACCPPCTAEEAGEERPGAQRCPSTIFQPGLSHHFAWGSPGEGRKVLLAGCALTPFGRVTTGFHQSCSSLREIVWWWNPIPCQGCGVDGAVVRPRCSADTRPGSRSLLVCEKLSTGKMLKKPHQSSI